MAQKTRESAGSAFVRACAHFVNACALLVEALAERARPAPREIAQVEPVSSAAPRLVVVPPPGDAIFHAALKKLGFTDAEVRGMAATATGDTVEARIQSALRSRKTA